MVSGVGATYYVLVDGGERAVIFDRFRGVLPKTVGEGTHFKIPFIMVACGRRCVNV